jgi:hypothetical protein
MIYIENKTETNEIRFPKSISNSVPAAYLYLENHLNNYKIQVDDTSNYSNYYVFNVLMSDVADGEYYAYLQDINKNILAQTIMYVGVSDEEVDYEYYEEPEVDVEYDPNLSLIRPFDVEITDRNDNITYYSFEDGIVPDDYFNDNQEIASVRFGESIWKVGNTAFGGCRNLSRIDWGGVTNIGDYAFAWGYSLTSLTIPSTIEYIGDVAFAYTALEDISIGSGVTEIGSSAFVGCENLTAITITATIAPTLGGEPFEDVAEIGVLTYPSGSDYSEWYEWLPYGWNPDAVISHFYLDNGTVSSYGSMEIFDRTFDGVEDIIRIEFGEGIEGFENSTIDNLPNLSSVTFPSTLSSIVGDNFNYCSNLTQIICNAATAPTLDSGVFYNIAEEGTLIIPNGADYSSWYSVLPIGWRPFQPVVGTVKLYFQNGTDRTDEYNSETLQTDIYSGDTTITKVEISSGFTRIGEHIFDGCQSVSSLTLPNGLTSIGAYAFNDCNNLTSLTLPDTLTTIGNVAFGNCNRIYGRLIIPDSVTYIGNDAFINCDGLTELVFGQNSQCTSIGSGAFQDCYELGKIYLPSSLQSIGNGAFRMCSELLYITCSATTAPTLGTTVFYGVGNASGRLTRGTLTYPSGSDYSTWYAQLPEKFDPNYNPNPNPNPNPGPGGGGGDDAD